MNRTPDSIPQEILLTRQWLREVFKEATRGLPLPYQVGLLAMEQAIAAGMFGGLLTSAWMLEELRRDSDSPEAQQRFHKLVEALEQAAIGPLPAQVHTWLRSLAELPQASQQAIWDRLLNSASGASLGEIIGSLWPPINSPLK